MGLMDEIRKLTHPFSDKEDDVYDEYDDEEELSFDCPNCGKTVMVKAADIDYDQSPVCEHCGEPFFTDLEEE